MLKLLSLNIEGDNHYERIFPFFAKEDPDVLCLQEFFLEDLSMFEEKLGMKGYAVGMWTTNLPNTSRIAPKGVMGVVIFSKLPFLLSEHAWYVGTDHEVVEMFAEGVGPEKVSRALLWVDVEKEGKKYRIATTHFTWSPAGSVTHTQRQHLQSLLEITTNLGESIVCGDFNAPRGKEIFETLAAIYTDNIPPNVHTTMDNKLHRISTLDPLVVDVLFTSSMYIAKNVHVIDGVSDHCAVVGEISSTIESSVR